LGSIRYDTTLDDDAPIQNLFRLGGFQRLSGLQQNELSGQHAALLRGAYMYRLSKKIVPTYAGISLELGNVWQDSSEIGSDGTILAVSLFLGADTFVGPLYIGLGQTNEGDNAFYLFLGQPFF
jgi:NTE family protein